LSAKSSDVSIFFVLTEEEEVEMEERKKEEVELGLQEMEEEMERREKEDMDLELEEVEAVGWRVDLFYVLLRLCCFFVFVLFFGGVSGVGRWSACLLLLRLCFSNRFDLSPLGLTCLFFASVCCWLPAKAS
jgi:hypothetical protein